MILIFGGAYQGKLEYALKRFGMDEMDVYRCDEATVGIPSEKSIIYEIDKWILALVKEEIDAEKAAELFIAVNKGAVVICNDISCGVVPIDPILRKWREAVGRALAKIAHSSDEVIRLFCGIPTKVK